jgi:hypothetical protein
VVEGDGRSMFVSSALDHVGDGHAAAQGMVKNAGRPLVYILFAMAAFLAAIFSTVTGEHNHRQTIDTVDQQDAHNDDPETGEGKWTHYRSSWLFTVLITFHLVVLQSRFQI